MAVLCGKCKVHHPAPSDVRACYAGDNTVAVVVLQPFKPHSAAEPIKFDCEGCTGDGKHYSGGAVVNGHYTGKIGKCYRCNGKGHQSAADRKRNLNYDRYFRKVYA